MQTATLTFTNDADYGLAATDVRSRRAPKAHVNRHSECLHCKRPLSSMRGMLFGARFCSPAHKVAYLEELDSLIIARLNESGKRIRAAMGLEKAA